MTKLHRFYTGLLPCGLLTLALFLPLSALAAVQSPAFSVTSDFKTLAPGPLSHDDAAKLFPGTVFFASQVAPVQARNIAGAKLPNGFVLAGIVDTSGYSSGVQERYQAYLLLDTPALFSGQLLAPGAYGCGIVNGEFLVLDLSAKLIFSVPAQRDAALKRPVPLQILAGSKPGTYQLYLGRSSVSFAPAHPNTAQ